MRKLFLSRITKMILVVAAVLVGPGLMAASADTISTFNFTGTFQNGAALGGTLTIDTTTGAINGIDMTVGASTFTFEQGSLVTIGGESFIQLTTTANASFPILDVFFPVSSLVGYTGGQLCISPVSGDCLNPTQTGVGGNTTFYLTQGSDSSSAPEPSSLLLLAGGLVGLGLLSRKMYFANGRA